MADSDNASTPTTTEDDHTDDDSPSNVSSNSYDSPSYVSSDSEYQFYHNTRLNIQSTDLLEVVYQTELPALHVPPQQGLELNPALRNRLSVGVDGISPERALNNLMKTSNIHWHKMSLWPNGHFGSLDPDDPRVRMLVRGSVDDRGWTPMHFAAKRYADDVPIVRSLLVLNAQLASYNNDRVTPIVLANVEHFRNPNVEHFLSQLYIEQGSMLE